MSDLGSFHDDPVGPGRPAEPAATAVHPFRRRFSMSVAALASAAAVIAGLLIGHVAWRSGPPASTAGAITATPNSSESSVSAIAAKVQSALVDINVTFGYQNARGAGTGIVLTSNGEVLTNNHVIDGATRITATDVGNGRTYPAAVVGYDATHDIAVIQLTGASGLSTAKIGNSSGLGVGQAVVAVGNAGGTGGIPTSSGGSVTGLDQSITAADQLDGTSEQLSGLIQVDADIQSGDSGGALVNTAGEVVGMNTAASQGYSFQTTGTAGYAIPINQAMATAKQIEARDASSDVHIGATAFLGDQLSSPANPGTGAAVSGVVTGGPAASAGLAAGDAISSLDGKSVGSATDVSRIMEAHHPGDTVQLEWVDSSGQTHAAAVTLATGPAA